MKLVADAEILGWLATRPGFQWDAGNMTKSVIKHGNTVDEVESVADGSSVFMGRIVEPAHAEPRYLLLGMSSTGKTLSLVFTRRGDLLRPISCRAMRKKEKETYVKAVGH